MLLGAAASRTAADGTSALTARLKQIMAPIDGERQWSRKQGRPSDGIGFGRGTKGTRFAAAPLLEGVRIEDLDKAMRPLGGRCERRDLRNGARTVCHKREFVDRSGNDI